MKKFDGFFIGMALTFASVATAGIVIIAVILVSII